MNKLFRPSYHRTSYKYIKIIFVLGCALFLSFQAEFLWESSLLIRKDEVQEIETEGNISMSQEDDVSYELDDRWLEEANSYEIAMEWSSQWNYTFPIRKPGSTKLKILFWDKFFWYQSRMDRYFYDLIEGAAKHPDYDITFWGPGFYGWSDLETPLQNFERVHTCDHFDWVVIHPEEYRLRDAIPANEESWNNDELIITEVCGKTKIFHEVHDCHDGKCFGGYNKHANVLAFRYGFIPYEYYNAKRPRFAAFNDAKAYNNAKLLTHIPDCANSDVFKPIPWEKKRKGAVLFGMVWYMLYPLREVVSDGIKAKVINATKFKHPGYNMPYDKNLPSPLMYDRKNPEIAVSIKVQEEYAKLLAETKICIFDSSIVKKAVRKFMEAFMVGCVVASDLPFEMEDLFRDTIIVLSPQQTQKEIGRIIQNALDDEEGLRRKAAKGLKLAREYFSCEQRADKIIETMKDYNSGFRGYYLPFSVRYGCHSFGEFDRSFDKVNSWCESKFVQAKI